MRGALLLFVVACTLACSSTGKPKTPLEPAPPPIEEVEGPSEPAPRPTARRSPEPAATPTPAPTPTPARAPAPSQDAPEISRSAGTKGGVIVFWPRVLPRATADVSRPLAAALQQRLRALVARALPGRPIDVRPEPERVCPRAGCEAMTVGAVLYRKDTGCVAVALVSGAGQAPARLLPWGGDVQLKAAEVPFRQPPESSLTVTDFARCDQLASEEALGPREPAIVAALQKSAS